MWSDNLAVVLTSLNVSTIIFGCTDAAACNYDSDATENDGSCYYAEENFDCNGICVAEIDCNGVCAGTYNIDECGQCVDNGQGRF